MSAARLFFALWPDQEVRAEFAEWSRLLASTVDGRPVKIESLHLTLVFLGDVALDRLDILQAIANKIAVPRFDLAFSAPGHWRHNRIVFAAPEATPQALTDLVATLEQDLRKAGFAFDQRAYVPHMTMMRRARWREFKPEFKRIAWTVNDFALVRSHQPGSNYEAIGKWQLGQAK